MVDNFRTRMETDFAKTFDAPLSYVSTDTATPVIKFSHSFPKAINFANQSGTFVTIHTDTGRVEIADGYSLDEASREFWKAVERSFPGLVDARSKADRNAKHLEQEENQDQNDNGLNDPSEGRGDSHLMDKPDDNPDDRKSE